MAVPLRGGVKKGLAIREKELFSDGEVPTAIKLEGGVKALMALPLKKSFLRLPYNMYA